MPLEGLEKRIQLLEELVNTPSPSSDARGVDAVQDIVAREASRLGLSVRFEQHPDTRVGGKTASGKFLIATLPGARAPFVDLLTHADTVYEHSPERKFARERASGTATGPGVIDDKGGIVVVLEALSRLLAGGGPKSGPKNGPKNGKCLSFRLICTPTEEIGSPGFEALLARLSLESRMVLGFEPALEDGSIIESRRGNRWYDLKITGREGHAGRDHRRGVNAAQELAYQLVELGRLTDYSRDLTVNIGQISGGSKFNVICGEASAKIDVRFSDIPTRDEAHGKIEAIFARAHIPPSESGEKPRSSYTIANDCPPFAPNEGSRGFVAKYRELIAEIEGASVQAVKSGGAADSCYLSREGLVVIDGLGARGGKIHSDGEFIVLESLETRAEALCRFLQYVAQGSGK